MGALERLQGYMGSFSETKSLRIGCLEATGSIQEKLDRHPSLVDSLLLTPRSTGVTTVKDGSLRMAPTLPKLTLMPYSGYHIESNRYNRSHKSQRTMAQRWLKSCDTLPWLKLPCSNARPALPGPDSLQRCWKARFYVKSSQFYMLASNSHFLKDTA